VAEQYQLRPVPALLSALAVLALFALAIIPMLQCERPEATDAPPGVAPTRTIRVEGATLDEALAKAQEAAR